jgi:1-aminocyclopropane-1-carboxylate deaminase
MLNYNTTPLQEIGNARVDSNQIKLFVKREDLNHTHISGNKWWKLKYNLEEAKKLGHRKLLTFGGAYSNHIYATAAAANEIGFESIGIIRGEKTLPLNQTLSFAHAKGMQLHFALRHDYRMKTDPDFVHQLRQQFGDFYLIPEGGSNLLAVKGCAEFGTQLKAAIAFDYLCLPVGTGATMAGIIAGVGNQKKVVGFSVLKGGDFLVNDVKANLKAYTPTDFSNWEIITNYHFGGYAKTTSELLDFKQSFELSYHIPLDHVYTAKMIAGIFDLMEKGYFKKGSTILAVHTGGLQGNQGVI